MKKWTKYLISCSLILALGIATSVIFTPDLSTAGLPDSKTTIHISKN